MTSRMPPTNPAGHRRLAITIALCGALAAIVVLLVVIPGATGGGWGVLNSLRPSSSASPGPDPAAKPASGVVAPEAQLVKACIKQTKSEDLYKFYLRDIPESRWGDPVRGTLSTFSEPYVLWLLDADCKPYKAVEVPAGTSRTFRAYVGQVWYYAEASATQPDGYDYLVFSPSESGAPKIFSDTGRLVYRTE
ncbi:hypothetical protein GA0074692_6544 [Micromonospora pallida]|uniref:Uncharacterized protein n=1 Tax=Micromonospora pallida TaxID=145854 RepID=A0A1C6TJI7_9ACTN|nr:hypothetical protein [Micromonospora pallida]SCL41890.1 hypothetical protein GA0074692_6544 [Micromonospora pallida]